MSAGGGVAFVGSTETNSNAIFGDNAIEIDAGANYAVNANLALRLLGGYILPDKGDNVWAVTGTALFSF